MSSCVGSYVLNSTDGNRTELSWGTVVACSISLQQPPSALIPPQHPPVDVPFLVLVLGTANDFAASRIGRYPVQRQRFPSKDSSISCSEGDVLFRRSVYNDMAMPGVQ